MGTRQHLYVCPHLSLVIAPRGRLDHRGELVVGERIKFVHLQTRLAVVVADDSLSHRPIRIFSMDNERNQFLYIYISLVRISTYIVTYLLDLEERIGEKDCHVSHARCNVALLSLLPFDKSHFVMKLGIT